MKRTRVNFYNEEHNKLTLAKLKKYIATLKHVNRDPLIW